jgi:hypothetical protein
MSVDIAFFFFCQVPSSLLLPLSLFLLTLLFKSLLSLKSEPTAPYFSFLSHTITTSCATLLKSEPGMDQACAVWRKLFAPFQCFHAHEEAVKEVEMGDEEEAKGEEEEEEEVTETSAATTPTPPIPLTTKTTALARALG